MERYNEYKDSGVQWLGEIPSHWDTRRIKYSCSLTNEKTQDKLPYVELENIESFTGKLLTISDNEPESICNKFEKDDVLFNKLRPYLTKCIIAEFPGKCTSELLVLRNFHGDNRFFKYLLLSPKLISVINMSTYGAKMPRANWSFIGNCQIPLPVVSVQNDIANYLDSVTSKIDEAIAQQQKMIDLLNERKQIIINNAVTKGLDPGVPMKDSGVDWIGEIPQHWKITRIKNCISDSQSGIWGDDERDNIEDKICVRVADFDYERGYVNHDNLTYRHYGHEFTSQKQLRSGDLLLEKSGGGDRYPVGRVVRYNLDDECIATCSNFIQKLTVTFNVNSDYLYYLFKAIYYARISGLYYTQTTGIQNLRVNEYLTNIVYLPDKTEQNEIADYLNNYSSKIEDAINQKRKNIFLLQERKQIIINDVVTGKMRVI